MKPWRCEHLASRAKAFALGGVYISGFFSQSKKYKWDLEIVFTLGDVHISSVFTMRGFCTISFMLMYVIQVAPPARPCWYWGLSGSNTLPAQHLQYCPRPPMTL